MQRAEQALYERLRERGVSERVLAAMAAAPRDRFAPADAGAAVWEDRPLALPADQSVSQPYVVGWMCDLVDPGPDGVVLDVGTGSGWHAAVLARLVRHVWTIERHAVLAEQAARDLAEAGIFNVDVLVGDGAAGLPERAPFDAINVAAACRGRVPPALEDQLADGGRLVAPVDERMLRVQRRGDALHREALQRVSFVPLVSDRA